MQNHPIGGLAAPGSRPAHRCHRLAAALAVALAALATPGRADGGGEAGDRYRLLVPEVVDHGTFTGVVVERTAEGEQPLPAGSRIAFRSRVLEVAEGGVVELPALEQEVGNLFITVYLLAPGAGPEPAASDPSITRHVEVLPVPPGSATRAGHASDVIFPGGTLRLDGQGLGQVDRARLEGPGGLRIELDRAVGSALQRLWRLPTSDLPPGRYRLVALDAGGTALPAANASLNPRLEITGSRVTRRGTRGTVTLRADADLLVELSGGEPYVTLEQQWVELAAGRTSRVPFRAHQVGDYQLSYSAWSPEEPPDLAAVPRADATAEAPSATFRPETGTTEVEASWVLTGAGGRPLPGVTVDSALVHPRGVEYQRGTTDGNGQLRIRHPLAGQVAASQLSAHLFRVLGHLWKPPPGQPPGIPIKNEACGISRRWLRKTPIRIVRPLAVYPAGAELAHRVPGTNLALSVRADDEDVLEQRCTGCGTASVRRVGPVADEVRVRWRHDGTGRLLAAEGETVFYQLPASVRAGRPERATVTVTLDNPPGKATDDELTARVSFEVSKREDCDCLAVEVEIRPPDLPSYDDDVTASVGDGCQPSAPAWETAGPVAGELAVPERLCPGALVILGAGHRDPDRLKLACDAPDCTAADDELDLPDPLSFEWSDGDAGGLFPLGASGRQVLYQAPPETGEIGFKVTVRESGTQAADGEKEERSARRSRRLFDLRAVNLDDRDKHVTTGQPTRLLPSWTGAEEVKRVVWKLDLGGPEGRVEKEVCSGEGLDPDDAALRFRTGQSEGELEVSWRLRSHLHGEKVLELAAWAEACGSGCLCQDDAWEASDFLTGDQHDRFKLFFSPFEQRDDGRVEDLATVRDHDLWGETTDLRDDNVSNWYLHWSRSTYGTCPYDHATALPELHHKRGRPGWLGLYHPDTRRLYLADAAARSADRDAFAGRRWIVTSDREYFDTRQLRQRAFDLEGHELVNKVFLHEMGHYRSMTANWEAGGPWRRAYGERTTGDRLNGRCGRGCELANPQPAQQIQLVANNRIRVVARPTGDFNGRREHGRDAVQKYAIEVELRADPNNADRVTHRLSMAGGWVVDGRLVDDGQGGLTFNRSFEVADASRRWRFRGGQFQVFERPNDCDGDYVPNQVEDQLGTCWDSIRSHPNHARGDAFTSSGLRQVPDQELYADQVVLGQSPAGTGLTDAQWEAQVDPGNPEADWANPGAQTRDED